MKKEENNTVEEKAYTAIRLAILQRKLTPGMKIPTQSLSKELGISRTPVRWALQQLSSEGFVEMKSNHAAHVVKPSENKIKEIYYMRGILEPHAIILICRYAKKSDIKKLREFAKQERKMFQTRNIAGYANANEQFHLEIARLARNQTLYETIQKFITQTVIILSLFDRFYEFSKEEEVAYDSENERLISYIENKDEKRAFDEMKNHISHSFEELALDKLEEITSIFTNLQK